MTETITYDRTMQVATGFFASKALLSAVELKLFGVLAAGPLEAEALRQRLGLHPRAARDFFDVLVALGFLQRDAAGAYGNGAEAARFLDPAAPGYIGGLPEMLNTRLFGFWGSLTEALRTGAPQHEAKSGGDVFGTLYADPARLEVFLRGMTGITAPIAEALAAAFPWGEVASVADIGAAEGCLPVRLALAHPHLRSPASTCRWSARPSGATSPGMAWRSASASSPATSSAMRCPRPRCW